MRNIPILTATLLSLCSNITASATTTDKAVKEKTYPSAYLGVGGGMDFGGLGGRLELMATRSVGLFAGAGYNFNGAGYNFGLNVKVAPEENIHAVFSAMYGYNAVLLVKNADGSIGHAKTYYGLTVGGGGEFLVGSKKQNKLTLQALVPVRNREFYRDAAAVNARYFPVALSLGFHVAIR